MAFKQFCFSLLCRTVSVTANPHSPVYPTRSETLPAWREVLLLTLPQAGLMLCHLAISLTDMWVAGQLDAAVQASLGVVTQLFTLLMLVTSMAGAGCMSTVSQALGAGLPVRASRYAGLIVLLAFGAGTGVGFMGLALRAPAIRLLGIPPDLQPVMNTFITAYCCQLPLYYTLIMFNSIFRAYKLMRLPLFALGLTAGSNCLGSLGFGLGLWGLPDYGYTGIAWATFGSTIPGLACNILAALRHGILSAKAFAPWRWCRRALPYLFRVGIPATLGQIATQAGSLVTLGILSTLPENVVTVVAGMSLGTRVQALVLFPVAALGMSITVLAGHLLGAGRLDDLYRFGSRAALVTGGVLILPALLLYWLRLPVAGLFTSDVTVLDQATVYLPFACLGIPLAGTGMVVHSTFAGAGATRLTCLVSCTSVWAIAIPLGYTLAVPCQAPGVYAAGLVAQVISLIWLTAVFRSKKWLEYGQRKGHNT